MIKQNRNLLTTEFWLAENSIVIMARMVNFML